MGQRAARGSVDLRHAAQTVCILHARVVMAMRLAYLAICQQTAKVSCRADLAAMRTGRVNTLVEGSWCSAQSFERHGSGEVEEFGDAESAIECERSRCGHRLRAVEEREPFLGFKSEWLDSGGLQSASGSSALALMDDIAFADESEGQMRERSEIAAGSDGAACRNDRVNAVIQQRNQRLDHYGANAAVAFGKNVGTQQQHRARFRLGERFAESGSVATNQIVLQRAQIAVRDANIGEFPESGVNSVC